MAETPFLGTAYRGRSKNLADQQLINLYLELVETKEGRAPGAFYMTPGLTLQTSVATGPLRGLNKMGSALFAVSGANVWMLTPATVGNSTVSAYTSTLIGTIGTSTGPVSMINNGTQLDIFDGVNGYMVGPVYTVSNAAVAVAGGQAGASYTPTGFISRPPTPTPGTTVYESTGDQLVLAGGTFSGAAVLQVLSTQASNIGAWAIVDGGTGGTPGNVTLIGTTGSPLLFQNWPFPANEPYAGYFFQITGVVNASGVLTTLTSITVAGQYFINPASLAVEPVTAISFNSGTGPFTPGSGGLSGVTLSIVMGVDTVQILSGGEYTQEPSDPVSVASATESSQTFGGTQNNKGKYLTPPTTTVSSGLGAEFNLTWATEPNQIVTLNLPFSGPVFATYQDGFGLVNQAGSNVFWQSDEGDLSTWEALNFSSEDADPDAVVAPISIHREVWALKEYHASVWVDAGLPGFSFQRLEGVYIEMGCGAAFSACKVGEELMWVGQNRQGQNVIIAASGRYGYQAVRVSTDAIDHAMATYPTVSDAIAYSYRQEGHLFYVVTFPSGNATWVYDSTASGIAGIPVWHQRASFSNGQYGRHWGNCQEFYNGQVVIGDYRNGNIYSFDLDNMTDNGAQRKWLRSWRALPKQVYVPTSFFSLTVSMETGAKSVPTGTAPQVMLRWTDDGGHTYSDYRIERAGPIGATAIRVKFNRLGSTRRNHGLDRIFELSSTDPFKVSLMGAAINE